MAHRLSAFVAKCFHEAKDYITVDDEKLGSTLSWIIRHQTSSGSFQEPPGGRVIHTAMQVEYQLREYLLLTVNARTASTLGTLKLD